LIINRAAMLKTIVSSLGRGKTKTDPMNNAELIDAELLAKIKVSGDDLDANEAQRPVKQLMRVELTDSKKDGNQFIVTMSIPGGDDGVFTMNMPYAKQVSDYRRGVVSVIDNQAASFSLARPNTFRTISKPASHAFRMVSGIIPESCSAFPPEWCSTSPECAARLRVGDKLSKWISNCHAVSEE
jgi:hypothetical protein